MIRVAMDTASDRCSVAASDGTRIVGRDLDGARRHAAAILTLLTDVLDDLGATPRDIALVCTADGPGSFTGLRVATSVAKALVWRREVTWRTAPSLLLRAIAAAPAGGGRVLALSDALRGQVYAAAWTITAERVAPIGASARAMPPADLAAFGALDAVVGQVPALLEPAIREATGHAVEERLPDARLFFALLAREGGTQAIGAADEWEPEYGRPAEAQAVWERTHGRPLPPAPGIIR